MKDFTLSLYKQIIKEFKKKDYIFLTLEEYFINYKTLPLLHSKSSSNIYPSDKSIVIMRHDVDRKPENALKIAKIENLLGINSSYYFRIVQECNKPEIIKQIAKLGHEIGYHYEDFAKSKGCYPKAIKSFKKNLEYFRKFYPIKTICMHGSPLSKCDNRDLWNKYNYKEFNIIAEPYFDINFNEIFYLTDASRSWNNKNFSFRDKVKSNINLEISSSFDILTLLKSRKLPNKILLNIHPHNWADNITEWYKIFIWQGLKNIVKQKISEYSKK